MKPAGEALRLAQGRLAALAWGRTEAPVWLALHGWLDNAASFARLAPVLAERLDIRLVAIDMAGHGHSERLPGDYDYAIWDYCHDLLDALDDLGLDSAPVLAHSLGAGVACLVAAAWPERIERLVLIDGLGALTTPPEDTAGQLGRSLRAQRRRRSRIPHYADLDTAVAARVAGGATPVDAETVRDIVARNLTPCDEGGLRLRTDPRLLRPSPVRLTDDQVANLLEAIACEVLLVEGRDGILGERPRGVASRARVRRLTRRVLEGGHHLHASPQHAPAVADAIVEALSATP
ncbi:MULTISPECIES: alpha/beta hydrolase [unclassified Halomonas]|uniref:alpha/beta fold hydrolase n=1 Tax=unclassified Halomonas TaxID=2609666 RepID=UPI0005F9D3B0|nr:MULTISPECIES: alpha/beta hydrolase [unclassified Halomonas]MBR9771657.1 alpha/beta hydrolase [Gammaproteobacteria bacterium]KJZ17093.1 alpha/beta hydrolase [Halomonas sp. S2151]MBY5941776.1 alpha/beta hydrolase [Halomonas sp. DP5N14-9]MBY6109141.1 alpha/beta hydrolase [Halomonas sp. DP1Y21-3]MCJ8283850.1 alpha/beta hydrolase [Halomonas sp.]|tara:strand:+ start:426 stop:1298 length:873 start_codon:yes stop_codon:yes gene_type:complete